MVVLLDHFGSGLNFPLSRFMEAVMEFYQIQLTHLGATSVTFLAVFVHMCKAFLARRLELDVFCHFFKIMKAEGGVYEVCSFYFFPRRTLVEIFPDFPIRRTRNTPATRWALADMDAMVIPFRNFKAAPTANGALRRPSMIPSSRWKSQLLVYGFVC